MLHLSIPGLAFAETKMKTIILALLLIALTGCAVSNVTLLDDSQQYPPTQHVAILFSKPDRPYKTIGLIEVKGDNSFTQPRLLEEMRKKAMAIGADAIIPTESTSEHVPQNLLFNPLLGGYQSIGGVNFPILRGIAIKYE